MAYRCITDGVGQHGRRRVGQHGLCHLHPCPRFEIECDRSRILQAMNDRH